MYGSRFVCFPRSLGPHYAFGDVRLLQQRKSESARVQQWASFCYKIPNALCDLYFRYFCDFYCQSIWRWSLNALISDFSFALLVTILDLFGYFNEYSNYSGGTYRKPFLELFGPILDGNGVGFLLDWIWGSLCTFLIIMKRFEKECIVVQHLAFFLAWKNVASDTTTFCSRIEAFGLGRTLWNVRSFCGLDYILLYSDTTNLFLEYGFGGFSVRFFWMIRYWHKILVFAINGMYRFDFPPFGRITVFLTLWP